MTSIENVVNLEGRSFGDSVLYNHKKFAHSGQIERSYAYPVGASEHGPGRVFEIHIPARLSGAFLKPSMSYLTFEIVNTSGNANNFAVDGNAYSFIQRLRVLQGGVVLSDVENYASVVNALMDISMGTDQQVMNLLYSGENSTFASIWDNTIKKNGITINGTAGNTGTLPVSLPLLLSGPLSPGLSNYVHLI